MFAELLALASVLYAPPRAAEGSPPSESDAAVIDSFSQCVVSRSRRSIVRVLQEVPGSASERDRLGGAWASWGYCRDPLSSEQSRLLFQPDSMRGPLTEVLFERDFPSSGRRGGELARLPDPVQIVRRRDSPEGVRRAAIVGVFAACVVERRPAEAAAVLGTAPGSREETGAIQQLVPEFGACFPAGSQFDITVTLLRGYLAGALYRRSAALAAAPPGAQQ
jgi:hypothetical protein